MNGVGGWRGSGRETSAWGAPAAAAAHAAAAAPSAPLPQALNWNVFEVASGLAIYPDTSTPTNRTYFLDLAVGEVVDVVFVNPSAMVRRAPGRGAGGGRGGRPC